MEMNNQLHLQDVTVLLETNSNNLKNAFFIYEGFSVSPSSNDLSGTYCTIQVTIADCTVAIDSSVFTAHKYSYKFTIKV